MDIIAKLQEAAIATRMKRLADRLWKDVTQLYSELGIECDDRWFSMLYALQLKSPQSITGLAQNLNLSHTAVNQLSKEMLKHRVIETVPSEEDKRKRLLSLTVKGQDLVASLLPVWEDIRKATRSWIDESGYDVMAIIERLEGLLDDESMYERAWTRIKGEPPKKIELFAYSPAMKKHYRSLYRKFLSDHYKIESVDEKLINDPNRKILKKGGSIIFASLNEEIVGTCSLMRHRNAVMEITGLFVLEHARGKQIGSAMVENMLAEAVKAGAERVYIQIDPKLKPAVALFRKFGFKPGPKVKKELMNVSRYSKVYNRNLTEDH